jgi:signal transduction histidine kinase
MEVVGRGPEARPISSPYRSRTMGRPHEHPSRSPRQAGDPAQLSQLFRNLIGNGVKFVARQAERVFGMFQRLHTREEYDGTGIGLVIAKKVVERHGGEIRASAREGGGTRFEFTLGERRVGG